MRKKLNQLIWFVDSEIDTIMKDDRHLSGLKKPALVEINAPLALIQTHFNGRMQILKEVRALIKEILEKEDG